MTMVTATELCELLERALERKATDAVIAFDGDGTLWSGDVGEDVFHYATQHQLLTDAPLEALHRSAEHFSLAVSGSASDVATQIFQAYKAGKYPEQVMCEVMTWCYAGLGVDELERLIDAALGGSAMLERAHGEVRHIIEWTRKRGVVAAIISASPAPIVARAAQHWGFAPSQIVAAIPEIREGRYAPRLAALLPYGTTKADLGRQHVGTRQWLASLGDNVFDWEMLHAATLGIAVRPKDALRRRLTPASKILLLNPE